ncbi:GNAT family N-acetyltransferase [Nodosilinea nodulosa]|uniref:GNAT family N-acetyltransferase n=1 Tax=Nodosilinea nodulosa TaxID=416001 RepID=UPI0002EDE772|nr:GNAT family N-acetyltransferase [Nodosilinea nodulosa]
MEIRFLDSRHVVVYRELRLQALRESPAAFASSYEQEAEFSLADFAARLHPSPDSASGIFGAFDANDQLVGLLGFSRETRPKRAHIASLWSMYVGPEFRGQGLGAALLDRAISHAQQLGGLRQIILSVTAGNLAARSLYLSRGFEPFGLERGALFVDGSYLDEEHLALYFCRDAQFPPAAAPRHS